MRQWFSITMQTLHRTHMPVSYTHLDVYKRQVTRASLRGSYGMVLQDTWLRAGTVRENIAYGKPDATRCV